MRWLFAASVVLAACGTPPPYQCSSPVDTSGRGLPLCHAASDTPVCDAPGAMAHYESNMMGGQTLTDGAIALCDSDNQVVCADRTVMPHCIHQPLDP